MDIFAHALWAGAATVLARRRWRISRRTAALTVAMAVMPDIPHLAPIVGWSVFGDGSMADMWNYANAVAGQLPSAPQNVDTWSHTLHCVTHSAVVAGAVTVLSWLWRRNFWIPLAGWWSHIVIDVFTHSIDYFPSPVLYPFTQAGFDGIAWNTPWSLAVNYGALAATWLALHLSRKRRAQ